MQYKIANHKNNGYPSIVEHINDQGKICGYASVFDVTDSYGDIIIRGAFSNIDASKIKLLWQHNTTQPIGKILKIEEDNYGLYIEAQLILDIASAREAYSLVKSGIISGLSIGFNPTKFHYNHNDQRIIEQIDLWEISLVTFPANQNATISAVKDNSEQVAILENSLEKAIGTISNN